MTLFGTQGDAIMLTATRAHARPSHLTPPQARPAGVEVLDELTAAIEHALETAPAETLPHAIGAALQQCEIPIERLLDTRQRLGQPDRYERHIIHADPLGRYTIVALVWRPGQATPVHGHQTWCAYTILRGEMREDHYTWHADEQCAVLTGDVGRQRGDVVAAHAGLEQIHRLNNASSAVAISLHVYGVPGARIATHVNRIAAVA